jgi:uncharacterized protein (DUF488 family)
MNIFTVGHSTHSFEELVGLLRGARVERLIDVRTVPRSRRMPHFAREQLERSLPEQGLEYVHEPDLGGFRRPRKDSPNGGWRVAGFQGYADHMQSEEFESALARLEARAGERPTAIMCAEGLWWQCHRRLISDALTVKGWRVRHIGPDGALEDHRLTEFAHVEGDRITYPPPQVSLDLG